MEKLNLVVPTIVKEDINEIIFYKESLGTYTSNIDNFVQEIFKMFDQLTLSPKIGQDLSSRVDVPTTIRYLSVQDYLLFYEIDGLDLSIVRILSGKSNWQRILFECDWAI